MRNIACSLRWHGSSPSSPSTRPAASRDVLAIALDRDQHGLVTRAWPQIPALARMAGAATIGYSDLIHRICDQALAKRGFAIYLARFPTYTLIYGAFATIPIFLAATLGQPRRDARAGRPADRRCRRR